MAWSLSYSKMSDIKRNWEKQLGIGEKIKHFYPGSEKKIRERGSITLFTSNRLSNYWSMPIIRLRNGSSLSLRNSFVKQQNQITPLKMGRRTEQILHQRRNAYGQQPHEYHLLPEESKTIKYTSHLWDWPVSKSQKQRCWQACGEKWNLWTIGGNINWLSP